MIATAEAIDTLESDLASLAEEIRQLHKQTNLDGAIAIGERLNAANAELANHNRGTFGAWVAKEFTFTRMTANNYMACYRAFGEDDRCKTVLQRQPMRTVFDLARQPEQVREAAIELAATGEKVTPAKVKELAGKSQSKPSSKTNSTPPKPNNDQLQQLITSHPDKLHVARQLFDACSPQQRAMVMTLWADWWEAT